MVTCDPTRIRTGVPRLKTSCPRPLDDGAMAFYDNFEKIYPIDLK
jgi:hypothetical protein